jgi:hypothetical protein
LIHQKIDVDIFKQGKWDSNKQPRGIKPAKMGKQPRKMLQQGRSSDVT